VTQAKTAMTLLVLVLAVWLPTTRDLGVLGDGPVVLISIFAGRKVIEMAYTAGRADAHIELAASLAEARQAAERAQMASRN